MRNHEEPGHTGTYIKHLRVFKKTDSYITSESCKISTMELGENLFGLCLSYLNIIDYNWMLNLPKPETAVVLCKKWKKESRYEKTVNSPRTTHYVNGKVYHLTNDIPAEIWYDSAGKFHRVGNPALCGTDGIEIWYFHGVVHRVGGPAVVGDDSEEWRVNGKLHREDGPALRHGWHEEWWINGKQQFKKSHGPEYTDIHWSERNAVYGTHGTHGTHGTPSDE